LFLPKLDTLKGTRDQALLALLVGCGLRRSELAALTLEHLQQRDGRWVIVDLLGKGNRVRSVPMPGWAKAAVDRWIARAGISAGSLLRPVNKADQLAGDSMTAQSVFEIVERCSQQLGIRVAPHDLRRTFAKLAHRGRAPLEQIQLSLGHASVQTTERYLGLEQDFVDAPCDHLGLRL
jgi:integrase